MKKITKEIKISGKVTKGKKKGRTLGFPTANVETKKKIEGGVYAGEARIFGNKYQAAIFVPQEKKQIEVHILDFFSDIYGKNLEVIIGEKIRKIKKFKNDQELACQILEDINFISDTN